MRKVEIFEQVAQQKGSKENNHMTRIFKASKGFGWFLGISQEGEFGSNGGL